MCTCNGSYIADTKAELDALVQSKISVPENDNLGDCKALRHGEMRSMHSAYLIREISTIISNNNNNDITVAYNTNASLVTCSYFGLSTWHWMFRMNVCESSNMRHTARAGVLLRQLSHCCCYFCFVVVTLNCKVSCKSLLSCVRHGKREEAGKPIIAIVAITLEPQMPHTIIIHILNRQTDRQTEWKIFIAYANHFRDAGKVPNCLLLFEFEVSYRCFASNISNSAGGVAALRGWWKAGWHADKSHWFSIMFWLDNDWLLSLSIFTSISQFSKFCFYGNLL